MRTFNDCYNIMTNRGFKLEGQKRCFVKGIAKHKQTLNAYKVYEAYKQGRLDELLNGK